MAISPEHKQRLRLEFLRVYNPSLSMMEVKKLYTIKYSSLNLPGCWPCQINYTLKEFRSDAEDLSEDQIQHILNPNSQTMPVKKSTKKATTKKADKAVVKAKKAVVKPVAKVVKEKPQVHVDVIPTPKPATKTTQTLPWGIKFLYVPKRK